jgi:hypothetical protein
MTVHSWFGLCDAKSEEVKLGLKKPKGVVPWIPHTDLNSMGLST